MILTMEHKRLLPFTSLYRIEVHQNDSTGGYISLVFCGNLRTPEYESPECVLSSAAFHVADEWVERTARDMALEAEIESRSDP